MDLTAQVDGYCERLDPGFWAEPVNAVTNLAFLIAAVIMWRRLRGLDLPMARLLVGVLGVIGLGSFLFHTTARVWAALADTLPILVFALLYIYVANRAYWRLPVWPAAGLAGLVLPLAALMAPVLAALPYFGISGPYWTLVMLFFGYGIGLRQREPEVARGLFLAGGLLTLSLIFRSLDDLLCSTFPLGTHFLWHCLNALLLAWVIDIYRRHHLRSLAAPASGR